MSGLDLALRNGLYSLFPRSYNEIPRHDPRRMRMREAYIFKFKGQSRPTGYRRSGSLPQLAVAISIMLLALRE